jgi:hypothetical protein
MAIRDRAPAERLSVISNPCGRCGGTGIIPFLNEATQAADETYCGICGGTGYGTLRFDTIGSPQVSFGSKHYADGVSVVRSAGKGKK